MAAVGVSLRQSSGIVMRYPVAVIVPHAVEILMTKIKTQHSASARMTKYEQIILAAENVTIKRSNELNPSTLLPMLDDSDDESMTMIELK